LTKGAVLANEMTAEVLERALASLDAFAERGDDDALAPIRAPMENS
jgi:hypothetical protein